MQVSKMENKPRIAMINGKFEAIYSGPIPGMVLLHVVNLVYALNFARMMEAIASESDVIVLAA